RQFIMDLPEESKCLSRWKKILFSITLEPMIFVSVIGGTIVGGSALNTNLLINKMCVFELQFNTTICDHLDLAENEDYENEVQERVNNFQMIGQWVSAIPGLIFSLFAGGLSDNVGRKPLLIFPIVGLVLTSLLEILNLVFIDTFPIEVFYVEHVHSFFGGMSVYYLGFYGFGTSATNSKERTSRLARFDGVEQAGALIGTFLSPILFSAVDYIGCYGIRAGCRILGLVYLLFIVREPLKKKGKIFKTTVDSPDGSRNMTCLEMFWEGMMSLFIRPVIGMIQTIIRSRPNRLRPLLWLQLLIYGIYFFEMESGALMYIYAIKAIPNYDGTIHSYMNIMMKILGTLALLFVIPLLSLKLKLHEGLILVIINVLVTLGYLTTSFAHNIWQFFLSNMLPSIAICKFSATRSLLTKCIDHDEVGKLYSFIALLSALIPIGSNPAFRQLYNATLGSFPSAFLLLSAALGVLTVFLIFLVYTQRKYMLVDRKGVVLRNISEHNLNDTSEVKM
ncbi:hypothetical protein TCAL_13569, partial [Tigriopus californicus]